MSDEMQDENCQLVPVRTLPLQWFSAVSQNVDGLLDELSLHLQRAEDARISSRFVSDADAIENAGAGLGARALLYVIAACVIFAVLWAVFGRIDKVVSAPGTIVTRTPLITMQAYSTSRVLGIVVMAGDHVTKGEVVARFDPTFARADQATLEAKRRSLTAETSRIQAELNGAQTFQASGAADSESAQQAKIFADQLSQYYAQMAAAKSRSDGINSNLAANERGIAGLQTQLGMAKKVSDVRRALLAQNAGSSLDLMVAESSQIDAQMRLESLQGDTQKLRADRAENEANRANFISKWREDLSQRLVAAQTELAGVTQDLGKAGNMSALTELRAPSSGTVLEVAAGHSVGSVLKEGETLVTIVPDNSSLFLETNIDPRDIGHIHVGDSVRVKLDSYPYQTFGAFKGRLTILGADSVQAAENAQTRPFYKATIVLDDSIDALARRGIHLKPGLTGSADIVTGRRSIAAYILNPLLGITDEGMREP